MFQKVVISIEIMAFLCVKTRILVFMIRILFYGSYLFEGQYYFIQDFYERSSMLTNRCAFVDYKMINVVFWTAILTMV